MQPKYLFGYVALLAVCFAIAVAAGWTTLGEQFDNDIYDFLFRLSPPDTREATSVIVGIDEKSLARGGYSAQTIRRLLIEGLPRIAASLPKAVAIDVMLADSVDEAADRVLAQTIDKTPRVVLASGLTRSGWDDPLPELAKAADAIGHVHADPDPYDNVLRQIPLEKAYGRRRYWALALEAWRLANGSPAIIESTSHLEVGSITIPGSRDHARPLRIRYLRPPDPFQPSVPEITFAQLATDPSAAAALRGKVVFVGITADSAAQDRHATPFSFGRTMPGVEIHANAYETLARRSFLRPTPDLAVLLFCLLLTGAIGFVFWRFSGWTAYGTAGVLLLVVHLAPWIGFRNSVIFPYAPPFATAWLAAVSAATFRYFFVRRRLGQSEAEKERYQRAIHFVAHEMRTPLTAIQGSSELMGRYKLPEQKRAEMAQMINAESKRLARLIQTFLDVERLSAGQMELKREPFDLRDVVDVCLERVRSLAERKRITVDAEPMASMIIEGDQELMEYAVYNLLTNAIKYSPPETRITVTSSMNGEACRLAVRDQGIGMDQDEMRGLFRKFYRTRRAEASGEKGTGIGLSLVQQIVTHHGGRMEVTSAPGQGSCFTMVVPAVVPEPES
jgi:signal transduction histidine kinase